MKLLIVVGSIAGCNVFKQDVLSQKRSIWDSNNTEHHFHSAAQPKQDRTCNNEIRAGRIEYLRELFSLLWEHHQGNA